jgi:uncharacterized protein (DUF1330 family)
MITFIKKITDRDAFEAYRRKGINSLDGTNAILRVVPGKMDVLEGDPVEAVAVVEFPDAEELKTWYHSATYQELVRMRNAASECQVVLVDGIA